MAGFITSKLKLIIWRCNIEIIPFEPSAISKPFDSSGNLLSSNNIHFSNGTYSSIYKLVETLNLSFTIDKIYSFKDDILLFSTGGTFKSYNIKTSTLSTVSSYLSSELVDIYHYDKIFSYYSGSHNSLYTYCFVNLGYSIHIMIYKDDRVYSNYLYSDTFIIDFFFILFDDHIEIATCKLKEISQSSLKYYKISFNSLAINITSISTPTHNFISLVLDCFDSDIDYNHRYNLLHNSLSSDIKDNIKRIDIKVFNLAFLDESPYFIITSEFNLYTGFSVKPHYIYFDGVHDQPYTYALPNLPIDDLGYVYTLKDNKNNDVFIPYTYDYNNYIHSIKEGDHIFLKSFQSIHLLKFVKIPALNYLHKYYEDIKDFSFRHIKHGVTSSKTDGSFSLIGKPGSSIYNEYIQGEGHKPLSEDRIIKSLFLSNDLQVTYGSDNLAYRVFTVSFDKNFMTSRKYLEIKTPSFVDGNYDFLNIKGKYIKENTDHLFTLYDNNKLSQLGDTFTTELNKDRFEKSSVIFDGGLRLLPLPNQYYTLVISGRYFFVFANKIYYNYIGYPNFSADSYVELDNKVLSIANFYNNLYYVTSTEIGYILNDSSKRLQYNTLKSDLKLDNPVFCTANNFLYVFCTDFQFKVDRVNNIGKPYPIFKRDRLNCYYSLAYNYIFIVYDHGVDLFQVNESYYFNLIDDINIKSIHIKDDLIYLFYASKIVVYSLYDASNQAMSLSSHYITFDYIESIMLFKIVVVCPYIDNYYFRFTLEYDDGSSYSGAIDNILPLTSGFVNLEILPTKIINKAFKISLDTNLSIKSILMLHKKIIDKPIDNIRE